jgi:hypothetical protein
MLTSEPDLICIAERMSLRMYACVYGEEKLKLPPDSPDASFTTELLGIAFPKGSVLTAKFNRM